MNKNKIRALAIIGIIGTMILVLIAYAVSNSAFNFKGNILKQKQKTGIGYVRAGRTDYKAPTVFFLGDFTTNMAVNDRAGKFVRVEVRLEMSDTDMADELKYKNIRLRDAVIEEMSLKRFSQVSTSKGKEELKENIKNRINTIVDDGEIKEVYFTQFIIQ
jgi:flagellar basal body-associated protein FliL